MVFKLLRIDKTDPCKIQLEIGNHLVGRGKFLHCDDKRVSRKHGELDVTDNSVTLKALHTNPCFYIRKGMSNREMLKQNDSTSLGNGDKFGLLPVDCWYEVLYLPDDDETDTKVMEKRQIDNDNGQIDSIHEDIDNFNGQTQKDNGQINEDRTAMDSTEIDADNAFADKTVDSLLLAPQSSSKNVDDRPPQSDNKPPQPTSPNESDQSQSLLQTDASTQIVSGSQHLLHNPPVTPENDHSDPQQDTPIKVKTEPIDRESTQPCPLKRTLPSSDVKQETGEVDEAKRIKTEPDNAVAGSSNGQNADQDAQAGSADRPPSPANPRLRERCMYGANCYRKNPVHKQEFSHPGDPDWGSGERGVCPYGRSCRRRRPAHWLQNTHPPGTLPPADRDQGKQRVVERNGNIFYISNVNAVNFYDDNFQVEHFDNSDGDSVDYDYEF